MRNIAITGLMGSGKSSIAAALVDSGFTKIAFADPIRNVASMAFGPISKAQDYKVDSIEGSRLVSGRVVLQRVGQSVKSFDNLFWTRAFLRNSDNYLDVPLVCDDMRFTHERDALRGRGWLIVGLLCPDSVRIERLTVVNGRPPTPEEMRHESEREVPDILDTSDIIVDGTRDPFLNAKKILEAARA